MKICEFRPVGLFELFAAQYFDLSGATEKQPVSECEDSPGVYVTVALFHVIPPNQLEIVNHSCTCIFVNISYCPWIHYSKEFGKVHLDDILSTSRHPCTVQQVEAVELSEDILALEEARQAAWLVSSFWLQEVKLHTKEDPELQNMQNFVKNGWPKYASKVANNLAILCSKRHPFSIHWPASLWKLNCLFQKPEVRNTDKTAWWPHGRSQAFGIGKVLQTWIEHCQCCQPTKPSQQHKPLISTPLPNEPWMRVDADIWEFNKIMILL